jgi:hypothetical protein
MSNCELVIIFFVVSFVVFIFGGLYFLLNHTKKPSVPAGNYVWRTIPRPEYNHHRENTQIYYDSETLNIRGKVTHQEDGLYLATMWNGYYKEFEYLSMAKDAVENYKPRVYK